MHTDNKYQISHGFDRMFPFWFVYDAKHVGLNFFLNFGGFYDGSWERLGRFRKKSE